MNPGTIISDQYESLGEIGRGHLGIVYKVEKLSDRKPFAIKVLTRGTERDVQRFQREVRAASKFDHQNIVRVYDLGSTADGAPYIVMELIDGTTLRRTIRSEGKLAVPRCLNIFRQICDALEQLHEVGIVHRDLKPANIMLVKDGDNEIVKLVDFGLALPADPEAAKSEKVTLDGYVTGTPAYMSPEQCMAEHVDSRSDIYSLGCVMFRALTGLPPIAGATPQDTMTKQVRTPPTPFARAAGATNIPPDLQKIILRCLEKKPEDRYQDVGQLKTALLTTA
jgi:eukaryotic-like serine/threonine-protein kinase